MRLGFGTGLGFGGLHADFSLQASLGFGTGLGFSGLHADFGLQASLGFGTSLGFSLDTGLGLLHIGLYPLPFLIVPRDPICIRAYP
jgi:hypothetical protein